MLVLARCPRPRPIANDCLTVPLLALSAAAPLTAAAASDVAQKIQHTHNSVYNEHSDLCFELVLNARQRRRQLG